MKRFFIHLLYFIFAVLIVSYLSDYIISNGLKKCEKGHFFTFNKLMNDTINADVLISGNSRGACAYNPHIIDSILNVNSINISVSGQAFGISYLRNSIYDRRNIPPKLLILNIDYLELDMSNNGYEREQYFPYVNDKELRPILKKNKFTFLDIYFPLFRYRGDIKSIGKGVLEFFNIKHFRDPYYKGYLNQNTPWNPSLFYEKIKTGEKIPCNTDPAAIDLLDKFITEKKEKGTTVVFVYAPLYIELKNNLKDNDKIMQIYTDLAKKHNLYLLDYSNNELCYDTTFFYDTNHLNEKGSEIFSKKLAEDIHNLYFKTE